MSGFNLLFGGSGTLKYQKFTVNGVFVPSAALLARGGLVFVRALSGGQGGPRGLFSQGVSIGPREGNTPGANGTVNEGYLYLKGVASVEIGAGGFGQTASAAATLGGRTSFGSSDSGFIAATNVLSASVQRESRSVPLVADSAASETYYGYPAGGYYYNGSIIPGNLGLPPTASNNGNGASASHAPANSGMGGAAGGNNSVATANPNRAAGAVGNGGNGGSGFVEVIWCE